MTAKRSIWKDSLLTLVTSFGVITLNMILAAVLSRNLPQEQFGDYLFIRRFFAFAFPLTTLSFGVGLTRVIAGEKGEPENQKSALNGSLILIAVFNSLLLLLAFTVPASVFTSTLFPITVNGALIWRVTVLWLFAYSGYILLYSYYRGHLEMVPANLVNLVQNGIAPLLIVIILKSVGKLTVANFLLLWTAVYLLAYILLVFHARGLFKHLKQSIQFTVKHIVSYSFPRIPAGLLLTAISYMLPFFLMKSGEEAVFFLSGLLVIQAVFYLSEPLSQVYLPSSSMWHKLESSHKIGKLVSLTTSFTIQIGLVATIQVWIWSDLFAIRWFGDDYAATATTIRYMAPAIIPAFLFAPLRSILDGIEKRALITGILTFSVVLCFFTCAIFYALSVFNPNTACLTLNLYYFSTIICLAWAIYKRVKFTINWRKIVEAAVLMLLTGGVSVLLHLLPWQQSLPVSLLALGSAGGFCLICLILWVWIRKPVNFDIEY